MAFKGDLSTIGLFEVFEMIQMSRKEGVLAISHEPGRIYVVFSLKGLKLIFPTPSDTLLGEILVHHRKLPLGQLQKALAVCRDQKSDLVEYLIKQRLVDLRTIEETLKPYAEEQLFQSVIDNSKADFEFVEGPGQPASERERGLRYEYDDVRELTLRGLGYVDDWRRLSAGLPSQATVYTLAAPDVLDTIESSALEREVCSLVDGRSNIKQILRKSPLSRMTVLTVLSDLIHRGTLEPAGSRGQNKQSLTTSGGIPQLPPGLVVDRKLGSGANGTVWKVMNATGSIEAVKAFHRSLDQEELDQVSRELTLACQLIHPGLVRYHSKSIEEYAGTQFIRMEFVDGESLKQRVHWNEEHCTPQPVPLVISWLKSCLPGIQHMHDRNVIHRDLHAGNIMLCSDGTTKLVDYGSARTRKESALNTTFLVPGALSHAAPEKWDEPSKVGPASDYFSLGVIAYLLLTGRMPFWDSSVGRLHERIRSNDYIPLSALRPDLPWLLSILVQLTLEKEPAKRLHDPARFAELLSLIEKR